MRFVVPKAIYRWVVPSLIAGIAAAAAESTSLSSASSPEADALFQKAVKPLLEQFCFRCHGNGKHKGDLALDHFADASAVEKEPMVWEKVLHHVRTREMPPEDKPQPSPDQRKQITGWIEKEVLKIDCEHPDPGRVTIRRLNRVEYQNTILDLTGVKFDTAEALPPDDSGYGFDNIGDVLSLSPILMEKYLAAAEKILDTAAAAQPSIDAPVQHLEAEKLPSTAPGGPYGGFAMALNREGELWTNIQFSKPGEYLLRARAFGQQAGPELPKLEFRLAGKPVATLDIDALERAPKNYEARVQLQAGEQKFSAAYINNFQNPSDPNPDNRDRNLYIDFLEVIGPIDASARRPSTNQVFICEPERGRTNECAEITIGHFARRAFRRPISDDELARLMSLYRMVLGDGGSYRDAVKVALEAALVSPRFLFRGEIQPDPNNPRAIHPIDEWALASRLSYFLWSTMPDGELFRQAQRGTLRANLDAEIRRMLQSPKSRAFVTGFAEQWLQTRNLDLVTPDRKLFPEFDEALRSAMRKETELFFESVLRDNRSVLEFLDADYSFVNERLARHYGIEGIQGEEFQRVSLQGTHRGGLLTMASVLTVTSNPTRTSPVKRGKWVLDNLLGSPPPPPPPDVPELKEDKNVVLTGSLRQRMEQHRENPLCASCHARMDPLGFGLENFSATGAWRTNDFSFAVDPSGKLVSGESFAGPDELRKILVNTKNEEFARCLTEKLLTYALGRGLESYDRCAVDQIVQALADHQYRFSTLISEVIKSVPFQNARGERDPAVSQLKKQ